MPGKPIVLATWKGQDPSLPSVLLNSHYDVVRLSVYISYFCFWGADQAIYLCRMSMSKARICCCVLTLPPTSTTTLHHTCVHQASKL